MALPAMVGEADIGSGRRGVYCLSAGPNPHRRFSLRNVEFGAFIVELDPGPLNFEPWAGASAGDVP